MSGNGYNGTTSGNPTLTTDRFGNSNSAYSFDGTDDWIYFGNAMLTQFTNNYDSFTISVWAKSTNTSIQDLFAYGGMVSCGEGRYGAIARLYNPIQFNSCNMPFNSSSGGANSDGTWHQYVFVWNKSTGRKVYKDGVLIGSNTATNAFRIQTYGLVLGRGFMDWPLGSLFNGVADEVRLWKTALSATEITSLYTYENNSANTGIAPTITNFNNYTKMYFDGSFTISNPTSTSAGAFTYTSNNAAVATIRGNTVTITGAGTANITATQAADATYSGGTATVSLTVNSVSIVDKYGRVSTTSVYYVNKNGSIGGVDAIDLNGKEVLAVTPAVGDFRDGGVVFWLDGSGGGLVVSVVDQSTSAQWGCYGTSILGANGTGIGTGAQNTVDIEAGCSTAGTAADICANLIMNGYSDWFLPSSGELQEIYNNRVSINTTAANNAGTSFGTNSYWSSREHNSSFAYYRRFNGYSFYATKGVNYRVRAVRAF
jgi:hypothetical protein